MRIVALLTADGTACSETCLVNDEDTAENRAKVEARIVPGYDAPVPGTWTDVSENDACWPDGYEGEDSPSIVQA